MWGISQASCGCEIDSGQRLKTLPLLVHGNAFNDCLCNQELDIFGQIRQLIY